MFKLNIKKIEVKSHICHYVENLYISSSVEINPKYSITCIQNTATVRESGNQSLEFIKCKYFTFQFQTVSFFFIVALQYLNGPNITLVTSCNYARRVKLQYRNRKYIYCNNIYRFYIITQRNWDRMYNCKYILYF